MGIESGGDDHKVRIELLHRREEMLVEGIKFLLVTGSCRQGNVQVGSLSRSNTLFLVAATKPGIVWELVCAEVKNGWVSFEDVLGAVAMMNVPIDDYHSCQSVFFLDIPSRDRGIIEQAEAHCPIEFCVMTGRANRAKGSVHIAFHYRIHCTKGSPDSESGNFIGRWRDHGFLITHVVEIFLAPFFDIGHVGWRVDLFQPDCLGFLGFDEKEVTQDTRFLESLIDGLKSVCPFGMSETCVVVQVVGVSDEPHPCHFPSCGLVGI